MNAKFKFLAVAALALTVGFTSCSKSEGETLPEGQKKVTISIDFGTGSGRAADNQTANGQTPDLKDLKLFFVGNNVIQKVETVTTDISDMTTGKSFTVPNATTKVYAIGNTGSTGVNSPTAFPAAGASEDDVKSLMIDVTAQSSFKIVNLSSGQGAGGTAASGVSFVNDAATFDIMPAVARYEIKKVSAGTTTTEVDQPLSGFKLTGIFITNTYNKLGLDYATLPSATADIIKVGPGSASFETDIPARLQDVMAPASNATSFIPTEGAGYFWHYFLAAPIAGKGTTLDGNTQAESSVPMIVLRIEDAASTNTGPGAPTYAQTSYINVRKLVKTVGGAEVTHLEPGSVYIIDDIMFGGEHLTPDPGQNHEKAVTVKVTVKPWSGVSVKPEL